MKIKKILNEFLSDKERSLKLDKDISEIRTSLTICKDIIRENDKVIAKAKEILQLYKR